MGVANMNMDSFLKTLLVEDCSCVVVVDNARCHHERWSDMPRRLRHSLTLESDKINTPPLRRKRKKQGVKRSTTHPARRNMDNPCQTRWGTAAAAQKKQPSASDDSCSVPAPPSCPQRQKSIEVKKQQSASRSAVPAPPSCPQRQQSLEVVTPQDWSKFRIGASSSPS